MSLKLLQIVLTLFCCAHRVRAANLSLPLTYLYGYAISGPNDSSLQTRNEAQAAGHVHGNYFVQLPEGESQSQVSYTADSLGFHPVVRTQTKTNRSVITSHFALGNNAVQSLQQQDRNRASQASAANLTTTNSLQQVLTSIFGNGLPDFFHLSSPPGGVFASQDDRDDDEGRDEHKNNHKHRPDNKIENEVAIKPFQNVSVAATKATEATTTVESAFIDYNEDVSLPSPTTTPKTTTSTSTTTTTTIGNQFYDDEYVENVDDDSGDSAFKQFDNLVSSDDVLQINGAAEDGYVPHNGLLPTVEPRYVPFDAGGEHNSSFVGPIIVDEAQAQEQQPEEDNLISPSHRTPTRVFYPNYQAEKQINVQILNDGTEKRQLEPSTTHSQILVTPESTPHPSTSSSTTSTTPRFAKTFVEVHKSVNTQNKFITEQNGQMVEQHEEYFHTPKPPVEQPEFHITRYVDKPQPPNLKFNAIDASEAKSHFHVSRFFGPDTPNRSEEPFTPRPADVNVVEKIVERPVPVHIPIAVHIPVPVAVAVPSLKNFHYMPYQSENGLYMPQEYFALVPPMQYPEVYGMSPPPVPYSQAYVYKTITSNALQEQQTAKPPIVDDYIGPVPMEKEYSLWGSASAPSSASTQTNTNANNVANANANNNHKKRSPDFGRNLRMEYGFKPPLVPSVEIDEKGVPIDKTST